MVRTGQAERFGNENSSLQPPGCSIFGDVKQAMQWADEKKYTAWE
jgi:hypothetical protein